MRTNSPHSNTRADEIWRRLGGMFGAEAVTRKYGEKPPPEWHAMLGKLNDFEIDRGVRRLAYSGKPHVPSLPEFTRMCRAVGDDAEDGPRPISLPAPDTWKGDQWTLAANRHLLSYVAAQACKGIHYCSKTDRMIPIHRGPDWQCEPETAELTGMIVGYKNAWARDMRETPEMPEAERKRQWFDCMARAEAACVEIRAKYA